jgi:hypothetical protein
MEFSFFFKPSIELEPEIFDVFRLGELLTVDMDRWAGRTSRSEADLGRLGFVGFHSPFLKPVLNGKSVRL